MAKNPGHEEILVRNSEAFFFSLELLFPGGDTPLPAALLFVKSVN